MLQKGLGHLAALYLLLLLVARYKLSYHKTICYHLFQYLQRIPYWKPLIISFCSSLGSTLLLIERTTIDPLYLWVIQTLFWRRCRGGIRSSQDIPSTHHKLLSLALHYLPFASRFPLPHFTLAILFALSFPFASLLPFAPCTFCRYV